MYLMLFVVFEQDYASIYLWSDLKGKRQIMKIGLNLNFV